MNFEKQTKRREQLKEEVKVVQSDPDSLRLYSSYSDKYISVDLNFPNIKSRDEFLLSKRTFDDFLKLGGKLTMGGEVVPVESSMSTTKNSSSLQTDPMEDFDITYREFQIIDHKVQDHFFRKKD